jgi:hypothetical protein
MLGLGPGGMVLFMVFTCGLCECAACMQASVIGNCPWALCGSWTVQGSLDAVCLAIMGCVQCPTAAGHITIISLLQELVRGVAAMWHAAAQHVGNQDDAYACVQPL